MSRLGRITSVIIVVSIFAALVAGVIQRQALYDWWRLKDYQPSQEIEELAAQTTMNDHGKRLFYIQHPTLADKQAFNQHCRENEHTIILGCYISRQGIFLYDVTDERLVGVEQVTAAHELLHAAYERLDSGERERVDSVLREAYNQLSDVRIKKTIATYEARKANINNELHSIIGTEVADLPDTLEEYYRKYFTDRSRIAEYSKKYEAVFTQQKTKIDQYDTELTELKKDIEERQNNLSMQAQAIKNERDQLNKLLSSNQTEAYNNGVQAFNDKVQEYNAEVKKVRDMITRYNNLVKERNDIAVEERELLKSLDSRITEPSTL